MTILYLIVYDLIAHDELHELSKAQSAIKVRPLFKFPASYFSLAYTTAVNQACFFQTSFIPLSGKFDRSPEAKLLSASFVKSGLEKCGQTSALFPSRKATAPTKKLPAPLGLPAVQ